MIQVTRWLDPEELVYHKGTYIKTKIWIQIEANRISKDVGIKTYVREIGSQLAIFREKIR